jgi:hypothetical protein
MAIVSAEIEDCIQQSDCQAEGDAEANVSDCWGANCVAVALAFADIEGCSEESTCEAEADAEAEVGGECDGELTLCSATAEADVELEGCDDGNYCTATSESEASVEDCNGADSDPDTAVECLAIARGEAVSIDNSNAAAENRAVADVYVRRHGLQVFGDIAYTSSSLETGWVRSMRATR